MEIVTGPPHFLLLQGLLVVLATTVEICWCVLTFGCVIFN
jgi:hypothetical protein